MLAKPFDYRQTIDIISFDAGHTLVWPNIGMLGELLADFTKCETDVADLMFIDDYVRAKSPSFRTEDQFGIPGSAFDYFGDLATQVLKADPSGRPGYKVFVARCHDANVNKNLFSTVRSDVPRALGWLKKHGFRLCVTSNAQGQVERNLKSLGLGKYFEFVLDSQVEGATKPLLFNRLIERTGVKADRILHVGDNPDADIQGALQTGMHAVHFDASGIHAREQRDRNVPYFRNMIDVAEFLIGIT